MFKKVLVGVSLLIVSISVFSADWRTFWNVNAGDCGKTECRCMYESARRDQVHVIVKGTYCPAKMQIDVESGQWKKI